VVSVLFAFASSFSNALNVVTQHVASTAAPARDKGWRLAIYLVRNPMWLFGVGAMIGAFLFQAIALDKGQLSVVQSILVTELVFSLVLGRLWLKRHVVGAAWFSACLTSAGLAVFLVMSEPKGGHLQATAAAWFPALLTCGLATAVLTVLASGGSPVRRAALYATASGIVWAAFATFLKSATDVLTAHGVVITLERGGIYGVVVAGIVGTVLTQAALHYGPLGVSQPLMVIVNPVVSIGLSVWLYGEHFTGGGVKIAAGMIGFAVMVVGVVFLARTAPSFEASAAAPAGPGESGTAEAGTGEDVTGEVEGSAAAG
jgi:drug/metabolite transporter (DMT)-like permease